MANPFEIFVMNLNQLGFYGFLLPWIFVFAVLFGLLVKTKAIGEDLRVIAVISMVVAFFVMGFGGPFLANFFINLFGIGAVILAGILVIALFMGMSGMGIENLAKSKAVLAALIGIGIIVFIISIGSISIVANSTVIGLVLFMIILVAAFALIIKN